MSESGVQGAKFRENYPLKSADLSACGWSCRTEIVIKSIELEIVVNSIEFEIVVIVVNAMDFEIDRVGNRSQSTSKTIKAKTIT